MAVVGVPRGGTSVVVGLLRILGFQLPPGDQECLTGETSGYRWARNPNFRSFERLSERINRLPGGIVWKDPTVAKYARLIDWDDWKVIKVRRDTMDVARSEKLWGEHPDHLGALNNRARNWYRAIDRFVPDPILDFHLDDIRQEPAIALEDIAKALGMDASEGRQEYAKKFVLRAGGYRCPTPWSCSARH